MKKRISIIEDNPVIRQGFAAVVTNSRAYEICGSYGNCEDALSELDNDQPDLVLMDIDLPGINGIDGTVLIRKKLPTCIILIITVLEESDKVFRSLCAGAGGYIIKNSETQQIVASIDEAFAGGAPMSLSIARMVVQSFTRNEQSPLSDREKEVLRGIAEGTSYSKIAIDLFISKETVRSHIKSIYQKLDVKNKVNAIKIADKNRWFRI